MIFRGLFDRCIIVVIKVHALVGNFSYTKMYFKTCVIQAA